ncbi:MAG: ATP-dependent zinc metalloprotease FtsH [Planctomycetes bacterium]|nr:ATP-dependent zinc metalloprotease FtsH [Planctomycetota bacterium]MBI3834926.1 ATP-dependent zinc metalloprotease FtsH [Planctomycetota bacterium]
MPYPEISISEFSQLVQDQKIKTIQIKEDGVIEGRKKGPAEGEPSATGPLNFRVNYPHEAFDSQFIEKLVKSGGGEVRYEKQNQLVLVLLSMLPWILIFGFAWFVIFRQLRGAGGPGGMLGSFGRSRHRVTHKDHTGVTFADVAGVEEAKEEVQEIVEFLKSPKKFQRLGGRIPRGVLLVGEPGCGKTLLAKAIAGEADVPFFSISGSDFVEMFVGVGASRVRDLFKQAKENSPCIIFLDEIDAVGRRRGASFTGGGHDEREQTLNAILVEMDGFETNSQVVVIAATNRADVLDPALIRPGRFDRQVYVGLPDLQGRFEILKVHMRKIKLGPNVDIRRIARGTPMFSGAELAALVNEAALVATMRNREYVGQEDLEEARDKIRWGRARKKAVIDERDRRITAYHEAGHAFIQATESDADPLHKVSIIPRGAAGGATFALPERDRMVYTKSYLLATMRVLFGGRIAEQVFFNDISSGASQDIRQATDIARRMVREWGMGENVGFVYYGDETSRPGMWEMSGNRDYSDKTAESIDSEVKRILDAAFSQTQRAITESREKVELIASALLKYETITGEEVNALIRGEPLERSGVGDLLDNAASTPTVGVARPVPLDRPTPERGLGSGPLAQPG